MLHVICHGCGLLGISLLCFGRSWETLVSAVGSLTPGLWDEVGRRHCDLEECAARGLLVVHHTLFLLHAHGRAEAALCSPRVPLRELCLRAL